MVDSKYLTEYRCPGCHKLLCKGLLTDQNNVLEVKCRGCGQICQFVGEDAHIISERSMLIRQGLIPDTDVSLA